MNKSKTKYISSVMLLSFGLSFSLMCGCSSDKNQDNSTTISAKNEQSVNDSSEYTNDSNTTENSTSNQKNIEEPVIEDNLKALLGEWKLVASNDENFFRTTDDEEISKINFYEKDGNIQADYSYSYYEYSHDIFLNTPLIYNNKSMGKLTSSNWYAELDLKDNVTSKYYVTLENPDILLVQVHSEYNYNDSSNQEDYDYSEEENNEDSLVEDEDSESSDMGDSNNTESYDVAYVYVKSNVENYVDIIEPYQYLTTVTVSNIKELYDAIDSRTHIILKSGNYIISRLTEKERNRKKLNTVIYDGEEYVSTDQNIKFNGFDNIYIEAEEGANVSITTEDPYCAPFAFSDCQNIILKGITFGHDVEPGYCTGSVIYLDGCSKITIDSCKLFGCGTYGVDAYNSYDLKVSDSEIYECSYGLISLMECSNSTFFNCTFRDSKEYSMIYIPTSYNTCFKNCKFLNNKITDDYSPFIDTNEYSNTTFENCDFKGNVYSTFSNQNLKMIHCSINDN